MTALMETWFTNDMTSRKQLKAEIQAGAYTTPNGDPIVEVRECPGSWCVYCGEVIVTKVAVTKAGMKVAPPGHCNMWRWFNGQFEPWHPECFDLWVFHWSMNDNGTVHMTDCRYAHDGDEFQGTRGEARHAFDYLRFCGHCAPLERWLAA